MPEVIARSQALPRRARLRARADFLTAGRGRRVEGRCFVVLASPSPAGEARLGLTVSRRVGVAVVRNRIKRLAREAFRRERARAAPLDVVLIARPRAGRESRARLAEELRALLGRALGLA